MCRAASYAANKKRHEPVPDPDRGMALLQKKEKRVSLRVYSLRSRL